MLETHLHPSNQDGGSSLSDAVCPQRCWTSLLRTLVLSLGLLSTVDVHARASETALGVFRERLASLELAYSG